MSKHDRDDGLAAAIEASSVTKIARAVGVRPQAVSKWRTIDLEYVPAVSRLTGLPPWVLRPDYFLQIESCRVREPA